MEDWKGGRREGGKGGGSVVFLHSSIPPLLHSSFIAGLLFIASLTLYIATLAPSVVTLFDDSLEFQLVAYRLGIAHPTGYPLYTLLGKLFTFLPAGNIAYRVNLMSAFFGAATVSLLYLLIVRMAAGKMEEWRSGGQEDYNIPPNPPSLQSSIHPTLQPSWPIHLGGIIGALLFAVGPVFWQQATIAEVYTLNTFFVVILLLVAVTLFLSEIAVTGRDTAANKNDLQRSAVSGRRSFCEGTPGEGVLWPAFLFGLSLTHHRTMVLLLPALVFFLYLNQKPGFLKTPGSYRTLLLSLLLGLVPLLLYLYLPLRGHIGSLDGTYENTWAGFWRQVSAGGYGVFIFGNPFDQERDFSFYWNLFQNQFYTVIPGFIGLFHLLWRGQHRLLLLTGTAFLTYLSFNLFYKVSDIEVFFIPLFLIWAAWSGVGAAWVLQFTATGDRRPGTGDRPASVSGLRSSVVSLRHRLVTGLILAVFAFIIFYLFQAGLPILRARNTWQVHDYGLDMLQQPLPERAAMVGILGEMTLLRYFQETENRRPDIETVAADMEADRLAAIEKLLGEGKTVYLTREAAMLPGTTTRWSLNAVGPLTRIDPEPVTTLPPFMVAVNQTVIPEITLLGYDHSRPPHTGEGLAPLRLTLFWQVTGPITRSLQVSARLVNPAGETKAVIDTIPVHRAYFTTAWRPTEIISDVYDLILPVDTPPDSYTPLFIWYDPNQNGELGRIELKPVVVE